MDFSKLIERVKAIVLTPKTEWEKIAVETTDTKSLFLNYAMILAAIPAIAGFLGTLRFSFGVAIGTAVVSYVLGLVALFVIGIIINALAGTFGATSNTDQAMKVAVYSSTPGWLAGVFNIIPVAGSVIALIGGLYGVYVLYLGLSPLMKNTEDKSVGYTALIVVCWVVLLFVIGLLTASLFMGGAMLGAGAGMFR